MPQKKDSTNNSKGSVSYGGILVGAFIVCCCSCLLVVLTLQKMTPPTGTVKAVKMKMKMIKEEGQERATNKRMQVRIIVYIFSWNEEHMMPLALAHYSRLADKIVVLDNHSTDQTRSIVLSYAAHCQEVLAAQAASPAAAKRGRKGMIRVPIVELRNLSTKAEGEHPLYVHAYWRTTGWKEAKGQYDWAIVVDTDEMLYWEDDQKKEEEEEEPRHCTNAESKRGEGPTQYNIARRFLETYSHKLVIAPVGYDMWCPSLDLPMAAKGVMGRLRKVKLDDDADDLGLLGLCNQGARGSRMPRAIVANLSKYCLINVARGNKALDLGPGAHVLRSGFSQALELDSERSKGGAHPLHANAAASTTNDNRSSTAAAAADTTIPLKLLHYGAGVGSWAYRWDRYLAIQPRAQKAPITGTVEQTHPKYSTPDFLQNRRDAIKKEAQEVLAPKYTCQTKSKF